MRTCAHWAVPGWYNQALDGRVKAEPSPVTVNRRYPNGRPSALKPDEGAVRVLEQWPFKHSQLLGRTTEPPEPHYEDALL